LGADIVKALACRSFTVRVHIEFFNSHSQMLSKTQFNNSVLLLVKLFGVTRTYSWIRQDVEIISNLTSGVSVPQQKIHFGKRIRTVLKNVALIRLAIF